MSMQRHHRRMWRVGAGLASLLALGALLVGCASGPSVVNAPTATGRQMTADAAWYNQTNNAPPVLARFAEKFHAA